MFWLGVEIAFGLAIGFGLLAVVIGTVGAIVGAIRAPANVSPDQSFDQSPLENALPSHALELPAEEDHLTSSDFQLSLDPCPPQN